MAFTIQIRRDTAANWTGTNPTLLQGEQGLETDTGKVKIGDGSTAWNSLAYNSDGVDWTGANTNFSTTGSIDATSALFDGSSDQVQVTVQGHSTQTSDIFVVENSAGTDLFSVNNSGNVTVTGTVDGRDLATDGSKLDGIEAGADVTDATNVSTALTGIVAVELGDALSGDRNCLIDFHADDATADYGARLIRNSGANGAFDIINRGTGNIDFKFLGSTHLSLNTSGNTSFRPTLIDGQSDAVQLTVQGNAVQTSDIFVIENSAGTDLVTVDNSGNIDVAGTGTFGGSNASGNALYLQSGDSSFVPADSTQIRFGFNNSNNYAHSIRTRHSGGTAENNAIDFYLWDQSTDAADDLGTHRVFTLDPVSSSLFGGLLIDGHSDSAQLTVQGHSTQTSNIFVIETSAGTDLFTVNNSGNTAITGTITAAGLPSGATAVAAGAATNELWVTSGHATLPDGVVMRA